MLEFLGVVLGNLLHPTRLDVPIQSIHADTSERGLQSTHFVGYAAQRPDIAFLVVRVVPPDLWARVVGCACLSICQSSSVNFGYVQISQFVHPILHKYVGRLQISVQYFHRVQMG